MLQIFTMLADLIVVRVLGLDKASHWGGSLHFFIEDTTKILFLLVIMIYLIAWGRAALNVERVRDYLAGKNRIFGYGVAAVFGAITPFCSCSSIPMFLGFTVARIPVGITMAFLITSPMINEVAVVMLGSMLGMKFMFVYIAIGLLSGMIGGMFFDLIGAEKYLQPLVRDLRPPCGGGTPDQTAAGKMTWRERHEFAKSEVKTILHRIWLWVIIGVGIGAGLHGFVPQEWIVGHLGAGQWWSVPAAVLLGIPLYANATGIIPVAAALLAKGLPVGTTMAFMMSTVAISLPEFIMLKQVMQGRMLLTFAGFLLLLFTLAGWILNALSWWFQ